MAHVCKEFLVSERRACRVLGQPRSTQRQDFEVSGEEERLVTCIIDLATRYRRYGYRRITALLRGEGWRVNHKRVERILVAGGIKGTAEPAQEGGCGLMMALAYD